MPDPKPCYKKERGYKKNGERYKTTKRRFHGFCNDAAICTRFDTIPSADKFPIHTIGICGADVTRFTIVIRPVPS